MRMYVHASILHPQCIMALGIKCVGGSRDVCWLSFTGWVCTVSFEAKAAHERGPGGREGQVGVLCGCVGVWVGVWVCCMCVCVFISAIGNLYSLTLYTFYTWKVCTCNEPGSPWSGADDRPRCHVREEHCKQGPDHCQPDRSPAETGVWGSLPCIAGEANETPCDPNGKVIFFIPAETSWKRCWHFNQSVLVFFRANIDVGKVFSSFLACIEEPFIVPATANWEALLHPVICLLISVNAYDGVAVRLDTAVFLRADEGSGGCTWCSASVGQTWKSILWWCQTSVRSNCSVFCVWVHWVGLASFSVVLPFF